MKKQQQQYRQGDVFIERIAKLPSNLKQQQGRIILAYGEVTGHAHEIKNKNTARIYHDENMATILEVIEALALLEHQEHGTVELEKGIYKIFCQREYSPEEIRNVAD